MGFIKAFTGALSQTFADQWKDYYVPVSGVSATTALFEAVPQSQNAGVGQNTKGANNIISNGSKIVVPEGMALITMQDGAITGCIAEPGGFIYSSDDPNSRSLFEGDGFFKSTLQTTWERVKFGGQPGSQQLAFYVNLKEIPGLTFGTQETVYWNDSYLEMKAGGMARGTYSLKITNPLLFIKQFVPTKYLQPNAEVFDFADFDNEAGNQLFNEFISSLSGAFARFSREAKQDNVDTMEYIQANQDKFALSMSDEIENSYHWNQERGIQIGKVSVLINYDEKTQEFLDEIRTDDKEIRRARRMGQAYSDNMSGMMAASTSDAMKSAASNEAGAMMGFMGFNMAQQAGANVLGAATQMQQTLKPNTQMQSNIQTGQTEPIKPAEQSTVSQQNPYEKLTEMKKLLDAGIISQADFDAVKNKVLGL